MTADRENGLRSSVPGRKEVMFNLEQAIRNWKRELRKSPAFEDGDIAELESHLREEIERLSGREMTEEQAFHKAMEHIGEPENLGGELYKNRATGVDATPSWKQQSWIPSILPNYVKVAFRSFKRNLAFSSINVAGLSIALAVSLLVITFVKDQAGYDSFHDNADRIYRLITIQQEEGEPAGGRFASTPYALQPVLMEALAEVEHSVRILPFTGAVTFDNERFSLSVLKAGPDFFDVFDYPLAAGSAETALDQPNSIVLSKDAAERFFGNTNPVGRVVTMQDGDYQVTGVLADQTYRSHLEFEGLISFSDAAQREMAGSSVEDWNKPIWYTYILLRDNADAGGLGSKLDQIVRTNYPGNVAGYGFEMQPLRGINLGERLARQVGRITPVEFVYFLSALALVIILAACVNYVNLTVARSMRRAKEIGLRKVIGAGKMQLVSQFLMESVVIALISLGIGLLIFWGWMLPGWNSLRLATADFGRIAFDTSRDVELYILFFGFTVAVGLLAGIYPAFKLSSFSPAAALKGVAKNRAGGWSFKKTLVVFQVGLSLVLIISTIVLYRQSEMLLNADYGFQKAGMVNVELGDFPYTSFRNEVAAHSGIEGVSASSALPGVDFPSKSWAAPAGQQDSISVSVYSVDEHFRSNFGLTLIAGRDFSADFATDSQSAVLVNETAVQSLGFGSPVDAVGEYITVSTADVEMQIVGVMEDFQFDFLWNPISPLVLRNNPSGFRTVNIQLAANNRESVLADIGEIWKKYEPVAPFNYRYYSDEIDNVYNDFEELVGIIAFLAVLAILMACFGLLAMAHYDTQARIKEVGVRKVLGARVEDLVLLLSTDFLKIVGVALALGVPLAIYLNRLWLRVFANKVDFGIWVISFGIVVTVMLTLAATGWQTFKAARSNPVNSLRSE